MTHFYFLSAISTELRITIQRSTAIYTIIHFYKFSLHYIFVSMKRNLISLLYYRQQLIYGDRRGCHYFNLSQVVGKGFASIRQVVRKAKGLGWSWERGSYTVKRFLTASAISLDGSWPRARRMEWSLSASRAKVNAAAL